MTSQSVRNPLCVELPDGLLELVSHNPLPALILEVPSEKIVAASQGALNLFSPQGEELVGRNFESFTTDGPSSAALELLISGRLHGYERVRHLRLSDGSSVPLRAWARTIGEEVPARHVFVVFSTVGVPAQGDGFTVPRGFNTLIGTTDATLRIDRLHNDVEPTVGIEPEELIGQTLFGIIRPEDVAGLMWALAQSTSTGKGVALHLHVNNPTGQAHLCQMLLLPIDPVPSFAFALISVEHSEGTTDRDAETPLREAHQFDVLVVSRGLVGLAKEEVPSLSELSAREVDVVTRLLAGHRVPAIARALFVSQSTVRSHLSLAFEKLGVESQQELIDLLLPRIDTTSNDK